MASTRRRQITRTAPYRYNTRLSSRGQNTAKMAQAGSDVIDDMKDNTARPDTQQTAPVHQTTPPTLEHEWTIVDSPFASQTKPEDSDTSVPTATGCGEKTLNPQQKRERSKRIKDSALYKDIKKHQWPIVYSTEYDISVFGLQKLHVFDAGKWGRIYGMLKAQDMLQEDTIVKPAEATNEDLLVVHSKRYLDTLKVSSTVARITEIPPVAWLPNSTVDSKVLKPLRHQTGGTILAAKLAMKQGWAINIGGGFHHCCAEMGGGFCAYADITLAIRYLFEKEESVKRAMIIDLDAHQGNGHERDFMEDDRVYIMDMYNADIYPRDAYAKGAIRKKVELHSGVSDEEYREKLLIKLLEAKKEFHPDIVIYNAGTDILIGDPLGKLNVTPKGVIERDQIVFSHVQLFNEGRGVPIVMVTSGGYQKSTAKVVADSILNLRKERLLKPEPEQARETSVVVDDATGNQDSYWPYTFFSQGWI